MSSITEIDPTSALFDACNSDGKPSPIRLFNEQGFSNPAAKKCIIKAIESVRTSGPNPSSYLFSHLPADKVDEFFNEMRALPDSEKQFLLLPPSSQFHHLNSLLSKLGLNGFYRCKEGEMVPSFGMMQTLLNVKYLIAPQLNPAYLTTARNIPPAHLAMLARLQLGYALLVAPGEEPAIEMNKLLSNVRITDEMRKELLEAQKQMPKDPLLKLLLEHVPASKL